MFELALLIFSTCESQININIHEYSLGNVRMQIAEMSCPNGMPVIPEIVCKIILLMDSHSFSKYNNNNFDYNSVMSRSSLAIFRLDESKSYACIHS